jgi:hypothetical protein
MPALLGSKLLLLLSQVRLLLLQLMQGYHLRAWLLVLVLLLHPY